MAATAPVLRRPALTRSRAALGKATAPDCRAALGKTEEGKYQKHAWMLKAIFVYHVHATASALGQVR